MTGIQRSQGLYVSRRRWGSAGEARDARWDTTGSKNSVRPRADMPQMNSTLVQTLGSAASRGSGTAIPPLQMQNSTLNQVQILRLHDVSPLTHMQMERDVDTQAKCPAGIIFAKPQALERPI